MIRRCFAHACSYDARWGCSQCLDHYDAAAVRAMRDVDAMRSVPVLRRLVAGLADVAVLGSCSAVEAPSVDADVYRDVDTDIEMSITPPTQPDTAPPPHDVREVCSDDASGCVEAREAGWL